MIDYRLRQVGDPVLEVVAPIRPVRDLPARLIPEMKRILRTETGLGLSAQQVGSDWRVALLQLDDVLTVAINLRITERSKETIISVGEGCLSLQANGRIFRTNVRRHEWVRIEYQDEQGQIHTRRLEGLNAIVAQHETDHLDGRCIADGLSRQQRRQAERLVGANLSPDL